MTLKTLHKREDIDGQQNSKAELPTPNSLRERSSGVRRLDGVLGTPQFLITVGNPIVKQRWGAKTRSYFYLYCEFTIGFPEPGSEVRSRQVVLVTPKKKEMADIGSGRS